MKCHNCGADLSNDTKFCSYCGAKIENGINSSAPPKMETNEDDRPQDRPSVDYSRNSSTATSSHEMNLKEKLCSLWKGLDLFCKVATIVIVVVALLLLVSICTQKGLAIFFSALQLVCLLAALLMHKGKIKLDQKISWIKYLVLIIAILFTALNVMSYSWGTGNRVNHASQTARSDPSTTETPAVITTVSAPYGSSDCVGKTYASIRSDFVSAGFVSVEVEKIEDLQSAETDLVDSIESISIDGETDFTSEQEFDKYDAVIIRYHTFEPYNITIHVDFVSNLIFSTYDVNLLINGENKGKLEHGEDMDFDFDLAPGEYTLAFESTDSSSVKGEVSLTVDRDTEVFYKIACHYDEISVEDMTATHLEEQKAQAAEDERLAAEAKAAEESAAMMAALEVELPQEMAKRAAIVAITNYCTAADVFMPDGNTLDSSKFHSYADTSGNFFNYYNGVSSWGDWTAQDENTWHVEGLSFTNCYGNTKNATLNVWYDGENYIVANIVITFGDQSDPNRSGYDEYNDEFVVAPNLVQDDREQTRLDSYNSWVNNQFSLWDGSHKEFTALIKKNLNDEKSYDHIETTYQIIDTDSEKTELNNALKSANSSTRVEIGDLVIFTQFSAKNAFNATIKNTAYGVVSFANNSITLISIE